MFRIIAYAIFSFILIYMIHSIYSHFQKQLHIPLNVNPDCIAEEENVRVNQENEETNLEQYLNSL